MQAEQDLYRLKIFRAPYEVECTYLSKRATHSKNLHISVAETKEPTFLIAYAEIIVRLCYPSTVTKVDWMWDNYVHSSSYGAFLFLNFQSKLRKSCNKMVGNKNFSPLSNFSQKYMMRGIFREAIKTMRYISERKNLAQFQY